MELEWDEAKRENNLRKHGLDFRDAAQVLEGYTLELEDDREDYGEFRYLAVGLLDLFHKSALRSSSRL